MIYKKGAFYKYEGSANKFESYAEALKASGLKAGGSTSEEELWNAVDKLQEPSDFEPPKVEGGDLSPLEQMWKSAEKISSPTE